MRTADGQYIEETLYLQVEPRFDYTGQRVTSFAPVAVTGKKPRKPRRGAVAIKLDVRVSATLFEPFEPEATVVVEFDQGVTTVRAQAEEADWVD